MTTLRSLRGAKLLVLLLVALVAGGVVDLERDIATADLVLHRVQPVPSTASASYRPGAPGGPVFVLAVGSDERPGVDGARGDALHLVGLNAPAGGATILNIPRDTWVDIPGHGQGRVNEALRLGGPQLQAATVSALTGAPISYVLVTTFDGLTTMVDALGGIEVDVAVPMHDRASGTDFEPGRQKLGGAHVLAYARDRNLRQGDLTRTANQGQLLVHVLESLRQRGTSATDVVGLLDVVFRNIRTEGADPAELFRLMRAALALDPGAVRNITMPGRIAQRGPLSVVYASQPDATDLFTDLVDDAILQRR